uniref:G protein gamma domain-containing protein n=1 Tax=Panagrellus redivivus TaxID=6233 RepID=A0A7E4VD46_PANRE
MVQNPDGEGLRKVEKMQEQVADIVSNSVTEEKYVKLLRSKVPSNDRIEALEEAISQFEKAPLTRRKRRCCAIL